MSRYLLEDGLHLSKPGHAEYHKVVAPVVRKAVLDSRIMGKLWL